MGKIKRNSLKATRDVLKPYASVFDGDKKPLKAKVIESPIGALIAVSNENNLLFLTPIGGKHLDSELQQLTKVFSKSIVEDDDSKPLKLLESELNEYFIGDLMEFKTPFEMNAIGTEFQQSVWNEIHKIEYGKTSTYSELARKIGKPKSYRAVANACGRNPISIVIPCHRVLASNNGLGGYSSGVEKKVLLLDLEKGTSRVEKKL
ncbi:methylated-DNA--protein-cysteine methyltransferase-like [Sitodiplosis mosellana]|uniref:methylated-DNA--protein-cysteine methyltransferase-like n=1 Tax=Sitodiplosis mosellana TaxID=263140 RepID=UPI0024444465|nr:methylated-DNA--protein-cysteine methyltransferase-like [Sitodiplosis mosellana]